MNAKTLQLNTLLERTVKRRAVLSKVMAAEGVNSEALAIERDILDSVQTLRLLLDEIVDFWTLPNVENPPF